jgi:hypothetical protein
VPRRGCVNGVAACATALKSARTSSTASNTPPSGEAPKPSTETLSPVRPRVRRGKSAAMRGAHGQHGRHVCCWRNPKRQLLLALRWVARRQERRWLLLGLVAWSVERPYKLDLFDTGIFILRGWLRVSFQKRGN